MLEFSARDYIEIAHEFGLFLSSMNPKRPAPEQFGTFLRRLKLDSDRLGLTVTTAHIRQMEEEIVTAFPEDFYIGPDGCILSKGTDEKTGIARALANLRAKSLAPRLYHHIEAIHVSLRTELGSILFRVVPREKAKYCDAKWLFETPIYHSFPNAWQEFQQAGRCYAYAENTACAFHLNRALEWGLKSLSVKLGKRFDRNSWGAHLTDIDKELTARYGAAGPRTPEEKFYSEAAAQFGNLKVAWRNPTMHIEAKYDDTEALYLLTTVDKFIDHLAANGLGEPPK